MRIKLPFIALWLLVAVIAVPGYAEIRAGEKSVYLESKDGTTLKIGLLSIEKDSDGYSIDFAIEESQFSDQFLSMRPFKCLDGDTMVCRLAYPYEKKNRVTMDDLTDLEYDFLFIVRSPKEYGIDPYNGRYYVIEERDGKLVGTIRAVDLNILAAPPDDGNFRPITEVDLDPLEPDNERFPTLRIE